MLLVDVDDDFLDRLQQLAVPRPCCIDDARTRHGELEALAAHGLDQDGELQFAAAGDVERILVGGFLDLAARHCLRPRAAGGRG